MTHVFLEWVIMHLVAAIRYLLSFLRSLPLLRSILE